MESQYAPLSEACVKLLCEKTYDKRKIAAAEIEKYGRWTRLCFITLYVHSWSFILWFDRMVQEFNNAKNYVQIRKIINVLGQDLATARDSNKRKGGLLGLAAASIAMGKVCSTTLISLRALELIFFSFDFVGFWEIHQRFGVAHTQLHGRPGSSGTIFCQWSIVQRG